jgi:hypothetical protein
MLSRRALTALLAGLLWGCGAADPSSEPRSEKPALPTGQPKRLALGDEDVALFFQIVAAFPDGQPPAFQPAAEVDLSIDAGARDMVARWQREFRSSSSPQVQAKLWRRDARFRRVIDQLDIEPEELARLMVRISTAVVRDSLDPRINLSALAEQADRAIDSLCEQYDGLDRNHRLSLTVRNGRAEFLAECLKETVAYREFITLLEAVPEESVRVAGRHRDRLKPLLPTSETMQAFVKRYESQATVIQAGHTTGESPRRR